MPSTISSSVSRLFASSTVITPSLPTFCIAFAIISPTDLSPLAEIVPTWAISSFEVTFFELVLRSATMAVTARSMPRLRSIGLRPAATALVPSLTIEAARTVAVVVPLPAWSFVFEATSRTSWAPRFSNLSASSISFATVTPSLVMRGAPKDFSMTTLRPFGPRVILTALLRISTPRNMRSRASDAKRISLADMFKLLNRVPKKLGEGLLPGSGNDAQDVAFLHNEEILPVDLDLRARPFAEQNLVAGLDIERYELAAFIAAAGPHRNDLAFLGLLLGGIGDDNPALGLFLAFETSDHDAVVQRTKVHVFGSLLRRRRCAIVTRQAPCQACG